MMHARRKFYEARTVDPQRSHQALAWISLLYDVERDAKKRDDRGLRGLRRVPARTAKRAIAFDLRQVSRLAGSRAAQGSAQESDRRSDPVCLEPLGGPEASVGGRVPRTGQRCVARVQARGAGRKNWLFAGSDQGGQTAAVLMSLCTTCKNLGIDPQAYLRDVLDRISTHPAKRIDELLPDRWQELHQAGADGTE